MKWEQWAKTHLNIVSVTGPEAMAYCPFHENVNSPSMQFNMEKGKFICFSCDEGGGIIKLGKKLGLKVDDSELDLDMSDVLAMLKDMDKAPKRIQLPVQPESMLQRFEFPTDYWGECPRKKKHRPKHCIGRVGCPLHRWIEPEFQVLFNLGYDPLSDAAIIPVRNIDGGLLGVIRRFMNIEDDETRYKYPRGYHRNEEMFGSWLVEKHPSTLAVVGEGSLDAIPIWQAGSIGLAQYGSSMSAKQIRMMQELGITEVCMATDNDKAGKKAMLRAAGIKKRIRGETVFRDYDESLDLRKHFVVTQFPWDREDHDPGSTTTEDLRWLIDHRVPLRVD